MKNTSSIMFSAFLRFFGGKVGDVIPINDVVEGLTHVALRE